MIPTITEEVKQRLFNKIEIKDKKKCWNWLGSLTCLSIRIKIQHYNVRELMFYLYKERWPDSALAHRCSNKLCCNPDHLIEKSQLNAKDLVKFNSIIDTKFCNFCKLDKPISDFGYRVLNGALAVRSNCKKCNSKRVTEAKIKLKQTNPEDFKKKDKEKKKRERLSGGAKKQSLRNKIKKYGHDPNKVFYILHSLEKICCICKCTNKELYLDHNHSNNDIRGLLCNRCNSALGHFSDNIEYLSNAIKYLQDTSFMEKLRTVSLLKNKLTMDELKLLKEIR